MAMQLRHAKCRQFTNLTFINSFSSSTSSSSNPDSNLNENKSLSEDSSTTQQQQQPNESAFASYFSDVKSSLIHQQQQHERNNIQSSFRHNRSSPPSFTSSSPQQQQQQQHEQPVKRDSLDEIRKNLSQFRLRSAGPPLPPSDTTNAAAGAQHISFHELYKKNVMAKPNNDTQSPSPVLPNSFSAIRQSLRQLGPSRVNVDPRGGGTLSSPLLQKLRSQGTRNVIGSDPLPSSVFDKSGPTPPGLKSELLCVYTHQELGEKLRMLRPEVKPGSENKFSLAEMNERLVKLREIELAQNVPATGGVAIRDLKESLLKLKLVQDDKNKTKTTQKLGFLTYLGRAHDFTRSPPKEELVEKYFHPDNMSSAEKMKIELQKVRDEFRMSESDCGSARVQVAQLTTKIKHLSTALHKKDKHSRKGLQEMVQKRKKLLRYIRRTDWDSYCFVLSKLGLRDNPSYKMTT